MTTPEWSSFKTKADVSVPVHGGRPVFGPKNYDSKGHEKKSVQPEGVGEGGKKKEEEQGFLSKYWWYILIAFMVLPRLFGGLEEPQGGQGQGPPAAATSR